MGKIDGISSILKLDEFGNEHWSKTLSSSSEIRGFDKTNDGGFIVISKEIGSNGNYIIKFDQNAEEEWRTHYYSLTLENTITGQLNVIHQRENGNFISGGNFIHQVALQISKI